MPLHQPIAMDLCDIGQSFKKTVRDPWGPCLSIKTRFPDISVKEKNDLVRHTYFDDRGEKAIGKCMVALLRVVSFDCWISGFWDVSMFVFWIWGFGDFCIFWICGFSELWVFGVVDVRIYGF